MHNLFVQPLDSAEALAYNANSWSKLLPNTTDSTSMDTSIENSEMTEGERAELNAIAERRRQQIRAAASLGGKAVHALGLAHKWTREEARAAGSRGGKATSIKRKLAKEAAAKAGA